MTAKRGKTSPSKQASCVEPNDDASDELAKALRDKYDDIKNERVPDRLQRLIDALREAEHMAQKKDED